jgi:integrase
LHRGPRGVVVPLSSIASIAPLEIGNPAAGKRRRLKVGRPNRTWLDRAEQIEALLAAAEQLDAESSRTRYPLGRVLLTTFTFAGPRLSEALDLRWRDIDVAAERLRVERSKTDAGTGRFVGLLPIVRTELLMHMARCYSAKPDALVFATGTGGRLNESNVRNRILSAAVKRANAKLLEGGIAPIPAGLTPHSLRRTFASILYALGRTPPEVMEQLGHTDPKLALRIYARAMRGDQGELERLRRLAGVAEKAPKGTTARMEPASTAGGKPVTRSRMRLPGA